MRGTELPPAIVAGAIVVAVLLIGFFIYRASQPPASTTPIPAAAGSVDPKNPAKPPVADEHANDWHPPGASDK